jgi:hypothetical protein
MIHLDFVPRITEGAYFARIQPTPRQERQVTRPTETNNARHPIAVDSADLRIILSWRSRGDLSLTISETPTAASWLDRSIISVFEGNRGVALKAGRLHEP